MYKQFDTLIKQAAEQHLQGADWRLLKAQLQAESALNPLAKSPVGAMGISQFMPKTWDQIIGELKMPKNTTAYNEVYAIPAAAYYMSKLYHSWSAPRPDADRYCLALASYNAGMGNLLKAQKKAGGVNDYYTISMHLHEVTREHSKETLAYVDRIFRTFGDYVIHGR